MNPLLQRISINTKICGGRACIRGTRVWVENVLDSLAEGASVDEIIVGYPALVPEDIRAAAAYAAEMVRDRYVDVPLEKVN